MPLGDLIKQGFHCAFNCRSLWLFGFFVGLTSGGSGGGGGSNDGGEGFPSGDTPFGLSIAEIALIVLVILLLLAVLLVLRFISEGALIEGVVQARQGRTMTTGEAFRAGRRHWTVILRISLIYFAVIFASIIPLVALMVGTGLLLGVWGAILIALPLFAVAVPWFITLHVVQAFAMRIAVLGGQRRARTAITQSWSFVRDRVGLAIKLIIAAIVGGLAIVVPGIFLIVLAVLLLMALWALLPPAVVIAVGIVLLLPVVYVFLAMMGTYRSSIWTIAYTAEVPA